MRPIPLPAIARKDCLLFLIAIAVGVIVAQASLSRCFAAQVQSPTPAQSATVSASPSPTPPTSDWSRTIETSQKLITALAIIIGGIWTWLKFFRGRTFRSRLELTISAKIIVSGTVKFLKATMEMKNVGLSQVKLKRDAIYLDVFLLEATTVEPEERLYSATWEEPVTFAVFEDHGWVEPGEEISDELLLQLPDGQQLACKLKLTVNSRGNSWVFFETEGTRWSATAIVDSASHPPTAESTADEKGKK